MIEQIQLWFKKAVPAPTAKNLNVQVGCHFEEVVELLEAITLKGSGQLQLSAAKQELNILANWLKKGTVEIEHVDADSTLDALADQVVTATGIGHMLSMDVAKAAQAVNSSNWSKFVDGEPVFDVNGKIAKGPSYQKVDLKTLTSTFKMP